jgi:type IV secretory pathway VirJ component
VKTTICVFLLVLLVHLASANATEESLKIGPFGTVTLYYNSEKPSHVVLFVSGDGGWNLGVVDMARSLAGLDALVAGIDITHYIKNMENAAGPCSYPASDFELLSKIVQRKLDFPDYVTPVLVGYSSGATLVYAALVQAPSNTFRGAISLGFCPDLPLTKPLCRGSGLESVPGPNGKGVSLLPATTLEVPWVALQGTIDQVCDPAATEAYVQKVREGEIVILPKVGHGFSVQANWMPQFKKAFSRIVEDQRTNVPPPADTLGDLPLTEIPSSAAGPGIFAVIVSGDGGWSFTEKALGSILAGRGIPVAGLNSLRYFWSRRTPEGAAKDLDRILQHYSSVWKKEKVMLIGYSRGADVVPFMANRLPDRQRSKIVQIVLLGPSASVDFQFHLLDWLGNHTTSTSLPVLPEVEKLAGVKMFCFYGSEEKETLCKSLSPDRAVVVERPGGHIIGWDVGRIAETILKGIEMP